LVSQFMQVRHFPYITFLQLLGKLTSVTRVVPHLEGRLLLVRTDNTTSRSVQGSSGVGLSSSVHPTSDVFTRGDQSGCTGPGCASSTLASGSPVRFSAPLADLAYSTEGSRRGPQIVAGGSVIASTAVVPDASESVSRHPMVSSNQEGSAVSVVGTDMAPRPSTSPAVGMDTGSLTGCSDPVRRTILSARARQQYDDRWCLFSQ
ncbi:hypothetical protein XENOCAPTIV_018681, partial [Xenoophorus captivus]